MSYNVLNTPISAAWSLTSPVNVVIGSRLAACLTVIDISPSRLAQLALNRPWTRIRYRPGRSKSKRLLLGFIMTPSKALAFAAYGYSVQRIGEGRQPQKVVLRV